jgi:hypothetical protein
MLISKHQKIPGMTGRNRAAYMISVVSILAVLCLHSQAAADDMPNCMVDAPAEGYQLIAGDFPPNDGWMMKQMVGRTLTYENGVTERFNKDGTYEVSINGETQTAPNYRLYSASISGDAGGFVCIDLPDLKFQRYVVNKTKLTLIDGSGNRYVATVE